MKVLVVRLGSYSCTGGIERICRESDRILAGAGMELTVVSLWDRPEDMPASRAGQLYQGCGRSKLRFVWRFLAHVMARRWDVVWFQHRLLAPLALAVRMLTRARIMVWIFGKEVWSPPSLCDRLWLGMADRLLSISTFTARKCEALYRVPHKRIRVSALGISQSLDVGGREEPVGGLPQGPFVLVVSRLVWPDAEQKGVLRVCEAMVKVIGQVSSAACVVVGEGPARKAIQARVKELGLEGRVVFTGRLSDAELNGVYRKAGILAMPSTVEGFGLVYVEAMANRVPVVAGGRDAAADVVVDGCTGLLVDPLDVEEIARAVTLLLKDEALRVKMGEAGYARFRQEFTVEAVERRLLAVFEEMQP
jgi:phosphatidyl-myo-inositol dimannoside synthase